MRAHITPLALICVAALALPRPGHAESLVTVPVVEGTTTVTGTLLQLGRAQLALRTENNQQMIFEIDNESRVSAGLDSGEPVRVTYHTRSTGWHLARVTPQRSTRNADVAEAPRTPRVVRASYSMADRTDADVAVTRAPLAASAAESDRRPIAADPTPLTQDPTPLPQEPPPTPPPTPDPNSRPETTEMEAPATLPATASHRPLAGLLGLLALGAGIGLAWTGYRRG